MISVWQGLGVKLLPVGLSSARQLDPVAALAALGAAGLTRIMCEGGGALAASLLQAGLVDELFVYSAGMFIGAEGHPMIGTLGLDRLDGARKFDLIQTQAIGADVMTHWRATASR